MVDLGTVDKPILMKATTEPTKPNSGYIKLWLDSKTNRLHVKHSDGRIVIIE